MLENASLFLAYSEFQHLIKSYLGLPSDFQLPLRYLTLAAAGAGGVTSFVLYLFPDLIVLIDGQT
jgi:mitochondrial ornithine carrier protein